MKQSKITRRLQFLPVLLLLLFFAAVPLHSAAQTVAVDGIYYVIDTSKKEASCIGLSASESNNRDGLTIESSVVYNGISYPVTSIGDQAFKGCKFKGTLTIPNSVKTIGWEAFYGCTGFTGTLTIPNSVTEIGASAFDMCSGFTGTLTIPNSVTTIGRMAFSLCKGFTGTLIIPNSVTKIGDWAFDGCRGFSGALYIGNSVTKITSYAFANCSNIESVYLPAGLKQLEKGAFSGCEKLRKVVCLANTPPGITLGEAFESKSKIDLYVPAQSIDEYKNPTHWYWDKFKRYLPFISPETLSLNPLSTAIYAGETIPINAIVLPEGADNTLEWVSSDSSIATVKNGVVTGVKPGKVKITAEVPYADISASCDITVERISISLNSTEVILGRGDSKQLTATVSPDNLTNKTVTWTSSDTKVATVASNGKVTAVGVGSAVITATCNNIVSASTPVYVAKIDMPDLEYMKVGESKTLEASIQPSELAKRSLVWSSSDESCATVNKQGKVTVKNIGSTVIKAALADEQNVYASCTINVNGSGDEVNYYYDSTLGGIVITKMPNVESYIVPATIKTNNASYRVKSVQLEAQPSNLKKVAYPDGISNNFASSIVKIPYSSSDCSIKDGVIIDKTSHTLVYADLSVAASYQIPSDVTVVGSDAFALCSGLREISIPASVTTIAEHAFASCTALSQVIIEDGTAYIEMTNPFTDSTMDYLYLGRKMSKNVAWPASLKSIETGRYVETLPEKSFISLPNLYSLTIGVGMRNINADAFYNSKITKVLWLPNTPPTGYSSIRADINYVSTNNYELNNMKVSPNLSSKFMINGLVYVFNRQAADRTCALIDSRYNRYLTDLDVPHKVTYQGIQFTVEEINDYALYRNKYYERASVGDGIVSIGKYALYNCDGIKNAPYIGKSVKTIDDCAFMACSNIPSIVIPDATEYLGVESLAYCSSLQSAILGKRLQMIERGCFNHDAKLLQIVVPSNVNTIANQVFDGCTSLSYLEISDRTTTLKLGYSKHNEDYKPEQGTIGGLSTAGVPLFNDCPLKELYIGGDISYSTSPADGYSPFYRNDYLEKVIIYDNETEISDNEFYGCRNLKEVIVGNDVTRVGDYAFSGCLSMEYFTLGSQVNTIGVDAFSDCDKMVELKSLNRVPPVCGDQATDDINKFTCKLYVPSGAIQAYKNANQWKNFFFIEGLNVGNIPVESISITPNEWTGNANTTVALHASIKPANADNKRLSWSSSNIAIAIVDEDGVVTLVGEGSCVITARANDGSNVSATCKITVKGDSGIDNVLGDGNDSVVVFTLQGIKLDINTVEELETLTPGLYIINGKKILVR